MHVVAHGQTTIKGIDTELHFRAVLALHHQLSRLEADAQPTRMCCHQVINGTFSFSGLDFRHFIAHRIGVHGVGGINGRTVHAIILVSTVGESSHGLHAVMGTIHKRITPTLIGSCQYDGRTIFIGQFERSVQLGLGVLMVTPDDSRPMSGKYGTGLRSFCRDTVFGGVLQFITQIHSGQIYVFRCHVVQFHPVVLVKILIHKNTVSGTYLIDNHRFGNCFRHILVTSLEFQFLVTVRQFHLLLRTENATGLHLYLVHASERGIPKDVTAGGRGVVNLHCNQVFSRLEERLVQDNAASGRRCGHGCGGIQGVGNGTSRHVDPACFHPVDVDYTTVVQGVVQNKFSLFGHFVNLEFLTEVISGILVVGIATIADGGGNLEMRPITQGCTAFLPTLVRIDTVAPVGCHGTGVAVFPKRLGGDQGGSRAHVYRILCLPAHKTIAGRCLGAKGYWRIKTSVKHTGGHGLSVHADARHIRIGRQFHLLSATRQPHRTKALQCFVKHGGTIGQSVDDLIGRTAGRHVSVGIAAFARLHIFHG